MTRITYPLTLGILGTAWTVSGQSFIFDGIGREVPDGIASGLVEKQTVSTSLTVIGDVNVQFTVSGFGWGGYNGDLFVTLQHGGQFSVLLNRPGARSDNPFGYGDSGLDIVLDDQAAVGDVHVYRLTLNGSETQPLGAVLKGTWAPDGRNDDPDIVLASSLRTKPLSGFNGLDPNGEWVLFVADLQEGGQLRLDSWGLTFAGVPEPAAPVAVVGLGLLAWVVKRRAASRRSV